MNATTKRATWRKRLDVANEPEAPSTRWWLAPLAIIGCGVLCLTASFAIYHQFFAVRPTKFVVLDLHRIIEAKEIEFTEMLSRPGIDEDGRKRAIDLVVGIEPQLKQALSQMSAECGCEILVKAAALTSGTIPDVTERVAQIMEISDADLSRAKAQLQKNIAATQTKP